MHPRLQFLLGAAGLVVTACGADPGDGDATGDSTGDTTGDATGGPAGSSGPATAPPGTTGDEPTGGDGSASQGETGDDSDATGTTDDPDDTTGEPSEWDGEPLPPEPPGSWMWVPFPASRCRDGSETGIGVRYGTGDGLVVFFEGGGACFNLATCLLNDAFRDFGALKFDAWKLGLGQGGIFDPDDADNPVADWSVVYVPYCTGDVHAGDREDVGIDGVFGAQQFVGYRNVGHYLERIVPTFADVGQVLVTGQSAGGFGAAFNYDRIAGAFPGARVTLLDDSGPPMRDMYLAPCLQAEWRSLWNLDATLPLDCDECFSDDGGGISNLALYLGDKHPDQRLALVSSLEDAVIRTFFGYGQNDCQGGVMTGAEFEAGLLDLRAHVFTDDDPTWGSFLLPGIGHTVVGGPGYFTAEVQGVRLVDWLQDLLLGQAAHLAP